MRKQSLGACLVFMAAMVAHAADHEVHWKYGGDHGPKAWGGLEPEFSACGLGKEQSPIDIRDAKVQALPALDLHYKASGAEVVNNGHTVQVNLADGGVLNLDGVAYRLVQFHFHTPSEEKVDGKAYAMVVHMVHTSADGKVAVVAVLLKEGRTNAALAPVLGKLPQAEGAKAPLAADFNAGDILPADHGYYKFIGSLTTPPCTEGVRWQVLKEPIEASKAQIAAFRKLYPMNARPVQPVNGRKIEQT
jgi:carbonic anhydrase